MTSEMPTLKYESSSDSGFESAAKEPQVSVGHRVILSNLPKSTTIPQLLKLIRGPGGTISADIYDTSNFPSPSGHRMAVVEFTNATAAEAFVNFASQQRNLAFKDDTGALHRPEVWLPKASGLVIGPDCPLKQNGRDLFWVRNGITRCFKAFEFPIKAVWFCLSALGIKSSLVNAEYDSQTATLSLEFVSLFAAHRAFRIFNDGRFPYYYPNNLRFITGGSSLTEFRPDSTDGEVHHLESRIAEYIPPDHLEAKFNRLPYNQIWPEIWFPIMNTHGLQPRPYQDTMLKLIQRCASLSRNTWSWEISEQLKIDHEKVVGTLDDPAWKDAWAAFFLANRVRTENLQRWTEYGGFAQHRRSQTNGRGSLVGDLTKQTPQVVKDFLAGKIEVRNKNTLGNEN